MDYMPIMYGDHDRVKGAKHVCCGETSGVLGITARA